MELLYYGKRLLILLSLISYGHVSGASHDHTPFPAESDEAAIAEGRRVGLDNPHIIEIRTVLADEHVKQVKNTVCFRNFFKAAANWSEAFGNVTGYLGMGATPLAGAVMLVPATAAASPYIILAGSIAIGVKVFCMGIASCSARESDERHQTLERLARAIGTHPVSITPTVTGPEEHAALQR